jgi:hypothetical protein
MYQRRADKINEEGRAGKGVKTGVAWLKMWNNDLKVVLHATPTRMTHSKR